MAELLSDDLEWSTPANRAHRVRVSRVAELVILDLEGGASGVRHRTVALPWEFSGSQRY
jgi:hypothetical protein